MVLLLGNGSSPKEFYFLEQKPARLIVSDISLEGLRRLRRAIDPVGPIDYAAIDGRVLPFPDNSLDFVYGYAFVHHLEDTGGFLAEVARVLRPGGRCVFMDDAYSPAWQHAKLSVLKPLMRYFHRKGSISGEDLRATLRGGFREDELGPVIRELGAMPFFVRDTFFHYLFIRASERLPPQVLWRRIVRNELLLGLIVNVDRLVTKLPVLRGQRIRLVWGFSLPG
jgi:SAM-dependent methyltransferase